MIRIQCNRDLFEYDIRGLVMAFFTGCAIQYEVAEERNVSETDAYKQEEADGENQVLKIRWEDAQVQVDMGTEHAQAGTDCENRKDTKTVLKRCLYEVMSRFTGKQLPWGTLTGIRPTKIPMALLEAGEQEKRIEEILQKEYLISPEKSRLSIEIAQAEKELLSKLDYKDGYSLYIGIPFCPSTCLYCSFTSYPISMYAKQVDTYLDCLEKEILFAAEHFRDKKLNTIYIGGGTPTTLTPQQIDRLCGLIEANFNLEHLKEFTIEAGRPDSVTEEKLSVIKSHPVDRISINPQTMKPETLKIIGRHHTVEQVTEVFHMARKLGFDNINMDLILGLPEETLADVENTMKEILTLSPDNLTVHSLAIKRAARLNLQKELYQNYRMENTEEMMNLTASYAAQMNMKPYYLYRQKNMAGNFENVGYAVSGKAGIYNILIMEEKQSIVALGAGATSKAVFHNANRIERAENVKDIAQYLSRVDEMIERKRQLFTEI